MRPNYTQLNHPFQWSFGLILHTIDLNSIKSCDLQEYANSAILVTFTELGDYLSDNGAFQGGDSCITWWFQHLDAKYEDLKPFGSSTRRFITRTKEFQG